MNESATVSACIQWLHVHGCLVHRNNTGAFRSSYTRKDGSTAEHYVRFGKKGSGDILACSPTGRWIEVECKHGKNKQEPEQAARQREVERRGGIYVLAYSADDLEGAKADILG